MADVRALLAAERQSRRVSHPHLTYTKNGALLCNVCDLNIKSEQLWTGHLKSQNHRRNVQNKQEPLTKSVKRKADDLDPVLNTDRDYDIASRKKPRAVNDEPIQETDVNSEVFDSVQDSGTTGNDSNETPTELPQEDQAVSQAQRPVKGPDQSLATIDEDEWAAFEREVAPLAQPDYSTATIEAAPISALDLEASKHEQSRQSRKEDEAEEEADESRRAEEEFDYMEELEERVKRLRDRREALRNTTSDAPTQSAHLAHTSLVEKKGQGDAVLDKSLGERPPNEVSSDDDEIDDWYG